VRKTIFKDLNCHNVDSFKMISIEKYFVLESEVK